MNNNLQLAVSHALSDARLARARQGLLAPHMGLDNKRNSAWCEYGFPQDITFADLYGLYRRGAIAHGAVNKLVNTCWKTYPEVIEGEERDETNEYTAWETQNKRVLTKQLWRKFAEADLRRLVGRYAGIILHIRDSKSWEQPVVKGRMIDKLTAVWAGALDVKEYDTAIGSPDYGKPKMWRYSEQLPNGATRYVDVHPDRVFILGDYSDDAISFLEPAYNAFVSLEKVEGGSGESFLKNASRQVAINFDKEVNLGDLAAAYGVSLEELQTTFNTAAQELNRGNDTLLMTQGASTTPLVTSVADPKPTYEVNLQSAAAALDIPSRILVGNQQSERSSTEDIKYFNARCQSRREQLSFEIAEFTDKLIALGVINPISTFTVLWDDLQEPTTADKLASAQQMAQINQVMLASGEAVFTPDEIRIAAGYEILEEPLGETDTGDEEGADGEEAKS